MTLYKYLSKIFLFGVPSAIAIFLLIKNQEPKVAWGFGGIILLVAIFVSTLKRVGEWVKVKEQSHDNATNIGVISQTTPFLALEIVKFTYYSAPIGLLILIDNVFSNYNGNISEVLGFVLLSYGASGVFNYLYRKTQQVGIQEKIGVQKEQDLSALKEYLKT
jgi:hypothetical protein